ncbi:hypothetical protein [Crocosphaera sp.]|uniref:hypothetical protein n=1 Tax=Crocosphaera sp. TaxID=2729996 RepID=UPI002605778F|nr:hypothetical protein [Crocosphaera sp.]MDJ0583140.1 hypothetical protein [Crocosphaera sp.]
MGTKAEELIKLARKNYLYLSEAELKLLRKVAEGEEADYLSRDQTENDPQKGYTWGQKRSPNIDVIIWLCTDKEAIECLTHKGISITGAKIDGCLDLDFIDLDVPLIFRRCYFSQGIKLRCARVKLLDFSQSYIASSEYAIFAQNAHIKSNIFLRDGFQANGQVCFYGATIEGSLDCRKGIFKNYKEYAIYAEQAQIKFDVFLSDGFKADGEVSFYSATIEGNLQCINSQFQKLYLPSKYAPLTWTFFKKRPIIDIRWLKLLFKLFEILYKSNLVINAELTIINGYVLLSDGFQATGIVRFFNARINGTFSLRKIKNPENMVLDLSFAKIDILEDDPDSWPEQNNLFLEGLVYETINNNVLSKSNSGKSRLEWIRRQNLSQDFSPQPYEQLAKVLLLSGYKNKAVDILIAKQNDLRKYGDYSHLRRLWLRILNRTIAHGYKPKRVFWYITPLILVGFFCFSCGDSNNLMTPSNNIEPFNHTSDEEILDNYPKYKNILGNNSDFQELSINYPKFNALMYSVDAFVPIINFHQQDYWLPNANKGDNINFLIITIPLNTGSLLRWYLWFHIVMGWFLSSLWVAGFTGLVRRLE